MNKFLVFASVLVCASADIGLKLREGSPTGSYLPGAPQTYGSGSNSYGSYSNGPQQAHYAPSGYSGSSNYHGVVPQGNSGYTSYGSAPQSSYSSYESAPQYTSYGGSAPQYGGYSVQQNFAGIPQAVQHHKSFFFDAPADLGETHVRVHVQPSAADGDKTIYIRAPAYNSKVIPHFNIGQQQAAGKTKVYVLVKKPEEQQDIVVPAAAQAPAAKPEVVFVKYSNQKEAEQKIHDIQEGASSGDSAKVVFNHRELVSSIKDEPAHHGQHHDISFGGPSTVYGGVGSSGHSISTLPGGNQHHETHYGPAGESGPY
ncbi:PREDICTED: uncharacterized protein LOC108562069 [Nicrophorus vespilloides]|uniref:Uncharacterized protein LOC108562069 n=1 Tax=Nicrophorus vespilloides TaxID=110193 RepID=A0ABM1MMG3_NICVS|nr:PREDICTED: uncharacterized protein LOC108562069 [Nicrophorus vespilloides]